MACSVKQGIKSKMRLKNSNAKYRLVYKTSMGQTLRNNTLSYSYSKSVSLNYKD